MSLLIDDAAARMADDLARQLGVPAQAAIRGALRSALEVCNPALSLSDKIAGFYGRHPRPEPTGRSADVERPDMLAS